MTPYNSIAIAGMSKNAGKTTTLNHMIQGFAAQGHMPLGLTSIGLDGEETDQVTATPKPRIHVPLGTIIATAEQLLSRREHGINDISREILAVIDDITTPLGRVVVAQALSAGNVMLAGPSMASQIPALMQILRDWGATKIIIDGAVGRKSLAIPQAAQAVVLATGASLSKSMETVISETQHIAAIFNTPTIGCDALCRPLPDEYIHIPGAITDKKLSNHHGKHILADDPTKILITPKFLAMLRKSGGTLSVKTPINLVAITINPTSPYGPTFDPDHFLTKMQAAVSVPVYNLVGATCGRKEPLC